MRWLPPQPILIDFQSNDQNFSLEQENYDFNDPKIDEFLEEEKKEEEEKSAPSTMNFKTNKKSRGPPKKEKRIKSSVENIERSEKKNKSNFDIFYFNNVREK